MDVQLHAQNTPVPRFLCTFHSVSRLKVNSLCACICIQINVLAHDIRIYEMDIEHLFALYTMAPYLIWGFMRSTSNAIPFQMNNYFIYVLFGLGTVKYPMCRLV